MGGMYMYSTELVLSWIGATNVPGKPFDAPTLILDIRRTPLLLSCEKTASTSEMTRRPLQFPGRADVIAKP